MTDTDKTDMPNAVAGNVYWVKIFMSPFLLGLLVAAVAVLAMKNALGIILAIVAIVIGCVFGYRMAESARKTIGTVAFSARTMTNTEFTDTKKKS